MDNFSSAKLLLSFIDILLLKFELFFLKDKLSVIPIFVVGLGLKLKLSLFALLFNFKSKFDFSFFKFKLSNLFKFYSFLLLLPPNCELPLLKSDKPFSLLFSFLLELAPFSIFSWNS